MNIVTYLNRKGIDTVDTSFYRKIDDWESWYNGNVRRFHTYKVSGGRGRSVRCRRKCLGAAKMMCEDIANLLLNERVTMTLSEDASYDYAKRVLDNNNFTILGNEYQERKAAGGTAAYVPYIDGTMDESGMFTGGEVRINYVDAKNIFPLSWDNGDVKECVFAFAKTCNRKSYVVLQYHRIEDSQYVITNEVVDVTRGNGSPVPPEKWVEIPIFEDLVEKLETGSTEPQFVIDKLNRVNNADEDTTNPMGVAIFANSIDTLAAIDEKYDSYSNEFRLGKKRIFVSPEMMVDMDGNPAFDSDDVVFYALPEDYKVDGQSGILKEVDMTLRVEEHSKAINDELNYLSQKCGFGSEHYKFDKGSMKTATEIISENSDLYRTVVKNELILDGALKKLIRIILRLGTVCNVPGLNPDVEIRINFDDSIIEDKKSEREQDRLDVSIGVMGLAEYRAKWYGETEEQAAKRLPETKSDVIE